MSETRPHAPRLMQAPQVRETARFVAVGGGGAVAYAALTWALMRWAGASPTVAMLVALAVLIPPVYALQRGFTFRSDRPHWVAFPRYLATQAFGNLLALAAGALWPAPIAAHPALGSVALVGVVGVSNLVLLKLWAFRKGH